MILVCRENTQAKQSVIENGYSKQVDIKNREKNRQTNRQTVDNNIRTDNGGTEKNRR